MKEMIRSLKGAAGMLVPGITGTIERRLLISVRIAPEVATRVIPRPLQPKIVDGWNIGGVCLIRLRHMRIQGVPEWCGLPSENAAHRFAVQWLDRGKVREGVYIPDRDTNSKLNQLVGGRLFPGVNHLADFQVWESDGRFRVGYDRRKDDCSVKVVARVVDQWPAGSVFESLEEISEFYRRGNVGWSDAAAGGCIEGMKLDCPTWRLEPLLVERFESGYLQDERRFPKGSVEFDSGVLMRNLRHGWKGCGVINVGGKDPDVGKSIKTLGERTVPA